jgi:tRNA dimethylallyltransferase
MSSTGALGASSVPVICGPTASGKSSLALRLAEAVGASIISADSRQVYRGFDIGTAKPTAVEQARVPHYGIDLAEPDERFTAADWGGAVPGWVTSIVTAGRTPLLVGGTGFYLRAAFDPLFDEPEMDASRRASLRATLSTLSSDEIMRWCAALDPARAALGRAQRERAIEVALLTGHRISDLHRDRPRTPLLTARYLVLDPGPGLASAIETRVDAMLETGWLDEVRSLAARVDPEAKAWTATGYDAMRRVATGDLPLERGREQVVIATRQYAKRQRTWFRHQLEGEAVFRLDPAAGDAFDVALRWLDHMETE